MRAAAVWAVGCPCCEGWVFRWCGAEVGLFCRGSFCVLTKSLVQIVDADLVGLGVGDGADMAGTFRCWACAGVRWRTLLGLG